MKDHLYAFETTNCDNECRDATLMAKIFFMHTFTLLYAVAFACKSNFLNYNIKNNFYRILQMEQNNCSSV